MSGFVWLVGAGPGDPGLLTVRAAELLRKAEVVAHDELISPEVMALVSPSAERLNVGRRLGSGPIEYRVHPAVVQRAQEGKQVIRLKAGDPHVFGRGGEEAEALSEAGVAFAIVPGITAAAGAAASTGIPLTHREHASLAVFASGHGAGGDVWDEVSALAHPDATAVIYMAGRKLPAVLAQLMRAGKSPSTPAALIVDATTPRQQVFTGTLEHLPIPALGSSAALLIVGDVVAVRARLSTFQRDPGAVRSTKSPSAGQLIVYTGQGKGKTTAALGLAFRALGRGLRVGVVQFIKGKWPTGERQQAAHTPGLDFRVMGEGFTWESDDLSRDQRAGRAAWAQSQKFISEGVHEVVVLDEITYAISYGFVALEEVLEALRARPAHVSVVLTGRHAPAAIVELADLVTDMTSVKHPFERGIRAQPGLDY